MDSEELEGVKFSEFPSATPEEIDQVVGLHNDDNARFSVASFVYKIRQGLANIFVPKSDVGAAGGVASLDNTGKVPSSQLPSSTGPEPATATPLMDGTGAVGASTKYAREDHEHPADTNKQAKITASGILKGDGQGGVTAATAGTDYATPTQLADKANPGQIGYPETGTTASRNYTAGEYICWNGLTYAADTNIATGTTLSASGGNKNLTECVGGGFNALTQFGLSKTDPPLTSPNCTIAVKLKYTIFGKIVIYEFAVTPTSNIPYNTYFLYGLDNASAGMNQVSGVMTDTSTGNLLGVRMSGGNMLCESNMTSGVSYRGIIMYSID